MIRSILAYFRERQARRRLAEIVCQTRASDPVTGYRIRRNAALSPTRKSHIAQLLSDIPGRT